MLINFYIESTNKGLVTKLVLALEQRKKTKQVVNCGAISTQKEIKGKTRRKACFLPKETIGCINPSWQPNLSV